MSTRLHLQFSQTILPFLPVDLLLFSGEDWSEPALSAFLSPTKVFFATREDAL